MMTVCTGCSGVDVTVKPMNESPVVVADTTSDTLFTTCSATEGLTVLIVAVTRTKRVDVGTASRSGATCSANSNESPSKTSHSSMTTACRSLGSSFFC